VDASVDGPVAELAGDAGDAGGPGGGVAHEGERVFGLLVEPVAVEGEVGLGGVLEAGEFRQGL
jgi:hypothetical protein